MAGTTTVDIGGVRVALEGREDERDRLRDYVAAFPAADGQLPDVVVRFVGEPPPVPPRPPDAEEELVRVWFGDGRMVLAVRDWIGSAGSGLAEIGGTGSVEAAAVGYVAQCCIGWMLASHGRFILTNVGAVGRDGRAWLVVGPSGRGKSTLVLAAIAGGWSGLADEAVVVRLDEESGVVVAGIHQRPAVPGDVPHPLAVGGRPRGDVRERVELATELLAPGWWKAAGVILVDHADSADGQWSPVESMVTLRALVPAFGATGAEGGASFLSAATAIAGLPGFRLAHGTDATTRLSAAAAFLDRLG